MENETVRIHARPTSSIIMLVEDIERLDWHTEESNTGEQRRLKSIASYHLRPDTWYPLVQDLTFETRFYEEVSAKLPFEQCMVRWENKSPKDSEYWGPVATKKEVERLFYTSLRCKTNPGRLFCFRLWIKLHDEYRCFWNGTLRAVSGDNENASELNSEIVGQIHDYISTIIDRIPYIRCIFDIGRVEVERNGELVFKIIEFNSWETNSGSHLFDWKEDSEILYDEPIAIHFRGQGGFQETRSLLGNSHLYRPFTTTSLDKPKSSSGFETIRGNYIILNNYIYCTCQMIFGWENLPCRSNLLLGQEASFAFRIFVSLERIISVLEELFTMLIFDD